MGSLSRVIRVVVVMGIAGVARLVLAADLATQSIEIPAQGLGTALLKFASDTHQQIAFDPAQVGGYKSTALSGTYTVEEGLHALIGTAPFLIRTTPSGVLTVVATRAGGEAGAPGRRSAETASAASSANTSRERAEVIVSAQRRALRAELAPKVSAFVYDVAALEKGDGVARWQRPVCPLVSGLPQLEGEFILARVSEIARAAGVALASEQCAPNLYVLVTTKPKDLLRGMKKRNFTFTFGGHPYPAVVDEFIDTPRPVRVWYDTDLFDSRGMPPTNPFPPFPNTIASYPQIQQALDSHLLSNVSYKFSRVFVIVDQTLLPGVSRGQLADYVGMVSLAQIKPAAHLGDAQTILKLFATAPQAAPAGMSDWDQAFLRALYGTEGQQFLQERSVIARQMVREIVP
jgi:hypothetical protein